MMKLLFVNLPALAFIAACVWFVYTGHNGFGIASLILAALCTHTVGGTEHDQG